MRKTVYIDSIRLLILSLATFLAISCSDNSKKPSDSSHSANSERDKLKIYIIPKENSSEYWQIFLDGARKAAGDMGIELMEKSPASEAAVNAQVRMLDDAVLAKPDGIVLAPSDSGALVLGIESAMNNNIPVILVDSKADTDNITAFLASDNLYLGALAADDMAKALTAKYGHPEGKIACITFLSGAASLDKRREGFEERVRSEYPGIEIVKYADAKGERGNTVKLLKDILIQNKDLKGVFANNLVTGEEVVQVLKELNRKDLAVVVVDYGKNEIWGLKNGFVDFMVVQKPWMMGYLGVDAAVRAAKGEALDKFIDTGVVSVSLQMIKENGAEEFLDPIGFNKRAEK